MLVLPIKKKWFDMIKSGKKKEEYREIKPYYASRFFQRFKVDKDGLITGIKIMTLMFRNGYSKNSPTIKCNVEIKIGTGKQEWGAEPNKEYYVLKILSVEEVK